MRGVEMADNSAGHAEAAGDSKERKFRELLQLHRSAVHQGDTDLSDAFEIRLREYCEQLATGPHDSAPLSEPVILDFAAMHGLISPRRQQREWSRKFNQKLLGFVRSVLADSERREAAAPHRSHLAAAETARDPDHADNAEDLGEELQHACAARQRQAGEHRGNGLVAIVGEIELVRSDSDTRLSTGAHRSLSFALNTARAIAGEAASRDSGDGGCHVHV
ncbi:hypothetical protein C3Z06_31150 (plasmid) [Cupriavidus metallidurans]|nr:hypothetical protein C3Z06_31150 [Cupriavidus metallidurans]